MRKRGLHQEFDGLIVEDMEMIAVHSCHAAMTVAHVFAKTDIGDDDQVRALSS